MIGKVTENNSNPRDGFFPRFRFGLSWIIILPGGIWGILGYYLPLMGGTLDRNQTWIVTIACVFLAAVSLFLHILGHLGAASLKGYKPPLDIDILLFGDVAHRWPSFDLDGDEVLMAFAGPLINLFLAILAYLAWNAQSNNVIGLCILFLCGFNGWMFVINLIPAFPLDGGRIFRLIFSNLIRQQFRTTKWSRSFGWVVAIALSGWGIYLLLQHARFSLATGLLTFLFVVILIDGLRVRPAMDIQDQPEPGHTRFTLLRSVAVGLLCLVMLAAASSLLLSNDGLDAPGVALSIEPMIKVPEQYRHAISGEYYLVTVISQAPIIAGEWVLGKVDPAFLVVPPEQVTPKNTTPQQQAKQDYQMLDDSETTAIAVGLRLAGYNNTIIGRGVTVISIIPGSHAKGLLEVGDIITGLDGKPVQTTDELINAIKTETFQTVQLSITRGEQLLKIEIPLMMPTTLNDSPKLGIQISQAGFDFQPPFPISIETNKISGGPSAGLMFTLAVYNSLEPIDLTGGRRIAGTGTISLDGSVGPIGGVKQKIYAAESVGAVYFLCPEENYADAISVARTIKVVKIATVEEAVSFLRNLPPQ